jgi:MFS family permease
VRILDSRERGLANGIQVGAYRIGMILGGGLLLWVFARTDWATMFLCMAGLLALTVLPVLSLREPPRSAPADPRSATDVALDWSRRLRLPGMGAFVVLICFYKFGDSMVATLIGPFMRDQGVSKEMIALMKGTVGSSASLVGAALGGWYAFRAGRRRALLVCGLLQTASLLFYVAAAFGLGGIAMLWAGNVAEHLLGRHGDGGAVHADDGRLRSRPRRHRLHAVRLRHRLRHGPRQFHRRLDRGRRRLRTCVRGRVRAVGRRLSRARAQPRPPARTGAPAAGVAGGVTLAVACEFR